MYEGTRRQTDCQPLPKGFVIMKKRHETRIGLNRETLGVLDTLDRTACRRVLGGFTENCVQLTNPTSVAGTTAG